MEGYIGEIALFGGNFAPRGWEFCNGQVLEIQSNPALYALIGNRFGGDGRTTFALPDLKGHCTIGQGTNPGLSPRAVGQATGMDLVTLNVAQIPAHNHHAEAAITNTSVSGSIKGKIVYSQSSELTNDPVNNLPAVTSRTMNIYSGDSYDGTMMADSVEANLIQMDVAADLTVTNNDAGGNGPHNNLQPYQVVSYIICLDGIYPRRS
jgi:microcystin-dependent protein